MRGWLGSLFGFGSAETLKLLLLDTETTGLNPSEGAVLEFGGRLALVEARTGKLISARESYSALQDPGQPLDPRITELTGITDAMVKGHRIDWDRVSQLMEKADIVVAHNAEFDRAFLEAKSPVARRKVWACSFRQMGWTTKGFADAKLVNLARRLGYEPVAHRAMGDVDALLHVLSRTDAGTKAPYFLELIKSTKGILLKVEAVSSPFEKKDLLKARGYFWNGTVWWKYLAGEARGEEEGWLAENIYSGASQARFLEIPALDRFRRTVGQP